MTTLIYSVLHFLIDGICAAAMFSRFLGGSGAYLQILAYNFCAFVLQMPFGALLDGWKSGPSRNRAFWFALAGVLMTIAGAFTSPVILGIGNALFHVGGGVGTILEDRVHGSAGRRLGIFVAPGAMGLFLGKLAVQRSSAEAVMNAGILWVIVSAAAAAVLIAALWRTETLHETPLENGTVKTPAPSLSLRSCDILVIAGCFCVVAIRSYVGMAVAMPWKTTVAAGLAATAAVVLGKIAGGFCAAEFGRGRTVLWSLLAAAVCYVFCLKMAAGILALLLFNMTMPVTLQILADRYRSLPGTMFGLLTVALFVGFLPVYFRIGGSAPGGAAGAALSLMSMALLLAADRSTME